MLQPVGKGLWIVDGPIVHAYTAAGLSLKGAFASWAAQVAGADAPGANEVAEIELPQWTAADEIEARLAIAALAARPMCLRATLRTLRLRLELASRSPLSPMPRARFDVAHVLANVGARRVMRVRIAKFAGEGQGQLRATSRKCVELDGDGNRTRCFPKKSRRSFRRFVLGTRSTSGCSSSRS